jgi:cell wall assembly regulator SMI1
LEIDNFSLALWTRAHELFKVHAPDLLEALQPPATVAEIEAVEAIIGVALPEEIRSAYLIHNGTKAPVNDREKDLFVPFMQFARLDEMVEGWKSWLEEFQGLDPDFFPETDPSYSDRIELSSNTIVRPIWWCPKWIPIGTSQTMSVIMVDLHPGPSGTFGQLLDHAGVDPPEEPVDSGLNHYLKTLIRRLEHGEICYDHGRWHWTAATTRPFLEKRPIMDWNNPLIGY